MTTSLKVADEGGRARLTLYVGTTVVGTANVPWHEYERTVRSLMNAVVRQVEQTLKLKLASLLWTDAQNVADGSADFAKKLLADFGWNQEKIDAYARELAREATQGLVNLLPEHD